MRKLTRNGLAISAAMAASIALTAAPAHADITFTVTPGGSITGTNSGALTAIDTTTGASVVCEQSTAAGSARSGDGNGLATLSSVTFATAGNPNNWCTGPIGIVVQVTAQNFPWTLNATSYDGSAAGGTTSGNLTGVRASIHGSDECDATIGGPSGGVGTIEGTYTNDDNTLRVTGGNLEVQTADAQCDPELINVGDQIVLDGAYVVNPAQIITSP